VARRKSPIAVIGAAGAIVGGTIGFLLRPSAVLIGQLPFGAVITRGATLAGVDQVLVPLAEKSFNIMVASALIGLVVGAVVGYVIDR
jgi:hypothetical protein